MEYPSIREEELPDYAKNATWNLFHAYMDEHSQILIDVCLGYGVQVISILKSQCENMTFSGESRYTRVFQKVVHKGGGSEINYIKIFHNAKTLEISVGNSYTEDKMMHNLLEDFQQGGK